MHIVAYITAKHDRCLAVGKIKMDSQKRVFMDWCLLKLRILSNGNLTYRCPSHIPSDGQSLLPLLWAADKMLYCRLCVCNRRVSWVLLWSEWIDSNDRGKRRCDWLTDELIRSGPASSKADWTVAYAPCVQDFCLEYFDLVAFNWTVY